MNIKSLGKIAVLLLLGFLFQPIFAQGERNEALEPLFQSGIYKKGGIELPYRFAHFNESEKSPVLIVFMHGHSAFGNDNSSQLTKETLKNIVRYVQKNSVNALVLAPQCNDSTKWTEIPEILNSFYSEFKKENGCSKILLAGDSMGAAESGFCLTNFRRLQKRQLCLEPLRSSRT